jgi:S-adenosylmethionine:tRNA ribosyltransferase-isomerase
MRVADFDYELPEELIAQYPVAERSASRLLVVDAARDRLADRAFTDLEDELTDSDLLVFNNTRVFPARLQGHKAGSGGAVEVLVERLYSDGQRCLAHVRASRAPRPGTELVLADGALTAAVADLRGELVELDFGSGPTLLARLETHGQIPLPPYIERAPEAGDRARYQTVYAREPGAVAAPTAGLHFDEALIERLRARGIAMTEVTLHVGAATFRPVKAERVAEHAMHAEYAHVTPAACEAIAAARARGGRVVAVGTTVVRTLESAAAGDGAVAPFADETSLFLAPGSRFDVVDGLITNFHLPRSTLLMLVCAFGGYERVLAAYRHAVAARYRFFSYGDAMLLWPDPAARGRAPP